MTEKQVAIICNSKTDITPNPKNTKAQTVMGFYDYAVLGNFLEKKSYIDRIYAYGCKLKVVGAN